MGSLVVVEETCMISHIRLLQSSISQLLEYKKLEVFLEGWLRSIVCRPNTPYSDVSSMLSLCMYCAWHGAPKSIVSGSLWFLSMGSTSMKNTVCLLLKFCLLGINPELMMECKLIAHPTWQMYSKNSFGINTLSCSSGSMELRPEWPWRARRYKIALDESVQYGYLFLFPPPAMLFFHLLSDQWWQYKKWVWRLSFILQNSIAPSSSPGKLPWRRRRINFFDTS